MTKDKALKLALEALEEYHYGEARIILRQALEQPVQEPPIDFVLAYGGIYAAQRAALEATLAQPEERYFCQRCGKRTADLTVIHTCTPPQENT